MSSPYVRLRRADPTDCQLLFEWVNLPDVRAASFFSDPIPFPTHEAWFQRKLADDGCRIFIALDSEERPAGVIRFERDGDDGIVSITVAPTHRRCGYASAIIQVGCREAGVPGISRFIAEIKAAHQASERAFARAGFRLLDRFGKNGSEAIRMELPATKETMR